MKQTTITKIVRLPDDVFDGVKIEIVILIYRKSKERSKLKECEVYLYSRNAKINSINENNCSNIIQYNQNKWELNDYAINISINKMSKTILEKI
ncbi:N-6 DNA methylase [Thermoplasma volcanium]|uniref:N-6 DNA methylase n=1 Tax=Thermoplasma volcanium TaxID=50339 RepID=UPI00064FC6CC|nr:N-6 DNA methylase [Thermoplasma volcanium]